MLLHVITACMAMREEKTGCTSVVYNILADSHFVCDLYVLQNLTVSAKQSSVDVMHE